MSNESVDVTQLLRDLEAIKGQLAQLPAMQLTLGEVVAAIAELKRDPVDLNNWKLKDRVEALEKRVTDIERGQGGLETLIRANHMAQLHMSAETARHVMPKKAADKAIREARAMVEDVE